MQFGSRIERRASLKKVLVFFPDFFLAFIIAIMSHKFVGTFIAMFLLLLLLNFLFWAKNTLWGWFLFVWLRRDDEQVRMMNFLTENKFPEPQEYVASVETYFINIANDESLTTTLRLAAAAEVGSLNYAKENGTSREYTQLCTMMEDTLTLYKNQFAERIK